MRNLIVVRFVYLFQRTNSPLVTTCIVAILYAIFLSIVLSKINYNFSYFITAGDFFVEKNFLHPEISIRKDSLGYDGQFYYRLTLDPFTKNFIDFGITFDNPLYRQQRIIYPLLTWIFSFGNQRLIPYILVTINFLALLGITYCGSLLAKSVGKHAAWGMLFGLYAGFLFTLVRDLTEITEILFFLIALLLYQHKRFFLAIMFFILMILSKETSVLLLILFSVYVLLKSRISGVKTKWLFLLPFLTYVFWHMYLYTIWGGNWSLELTNNIGIPFVGISSFINQIMRLGNHFERVWMIEIITLFIFSFITLVSIRKSSAYLFEKTAWILYLILILSLTNTVWSEDWAFMRALSEFYILGIILLLKSQRRFAFNLPIITSQVFLWLFVSYDIIKYRLG